MNDTGIFLEKIKSLGRIPDRICEFSFGGCCFGLYPPVPQDAVLKALYEKLQERSEERRSVCKLG